MVEKEADANAIQTCTRYHDRACRMLLVSWTLLLFVFYVRVVSPVDISLGPDSRRLSAVPSSLPTPLSTCHLLPVLPGHHSHYSRGLFRSRRPVSSRVSAIATLLSSCCYFYFVVTWSPTPARPAPNHLC